MKIIKFFLACFCFAAFCGLAWAQDVDENDVVKITSKVVQVDVVVTDGDGKQVVGLKASDFTILQDGKSQSISGFSYIAMGGSEAPFKENPNKEQLPIPPGVVKPQLRGRIVTFVVDDGNCRASAVGMKASREALEKFVTEQMLPDDSVAIYQTRSGSSMFQQYTSDKAQLLRAAQKIRWYPPAGGCATSDGSFYDAARITNEVMATERGDRGAPEESEAEKKRREMSEDRSRDNQVVGSLGVLRYAIRGLDRLPGRKVLFFLSDGIPLHARDGQTLNAVDKLRDLTDLANRSGVVLNTIDTRGLFDASMIEARDRVSTLENPLGTEAISERRVREVRNSQDGLAFLAGETGGDFFKNENYLDAPIGRALRIEKGYYLLAYEPDDATFKGKNFNKIEVKLNRPNLHVSSRSGFVGVVDKVTSQKAKTGDSELYEAIAAPLPTAGMNLRLSASFGNSSKEGSFVRALIHVPGGEVTLIDSNGVKKAAFDVVAVTLDEKNDVVDEFTRSHSFSVDPAAAPLIAKNGLVYTADVKVLKPGFYTFRVAMRDANSKRLGTVSQVIQVPELKPGRLFVSGLVVTGVDAKGKFSMPAAADPSNAFELPASQSVAGIRIFRRGSVVAYPYYIYNAKRSAEGKPNLTVEVNLFQEGKLVIDGEPRPADLQPQTDWSRIIDYGYLRLNQQVPAGEYVLQIIVRDLSAGKNATATQWTDFQVID
ncbi:MAG TPA: VWA domain-containing protein [Pyrinomonadaceae bacterium]|nr:VWA domain-containing protein [Pyrinomonadaceae bacterium]